MRHVFCVICLLFLFFIHIWRDRETKKKREKSRDFVLEIYHKSFKLVVHTSLCSVIFDLFAMISSNLITQYIIDVLGNINDEINRLGDICSVSRG